MQESIELGTLSQSTKYLEANNLNIVELCSIEPKTVRNWRKSEKLFNEASKKKERSLFLILKLFIEFKKSPVGSRNIFFSTLMYEKLQSTETRLVEEIRNNPDNPLIFEVFETKLAKLSSVKVQSKSERKQNIKKLLESKGYSSNY